MKYMFFLGIIVKNRAMIKELVKEYPKQMICALLDCPRSTVGYKLVVNTEYTKVVEAIELILMRWPVILLLRFIIRTMEDNMLLPTLRTCWTMLMSKSLCMLLISPLRTHWLNGLSEP